MISDSRGHRRLAAWTSRHVFIVVYWTRRTDGRTDVLYVNQPLMIITSLPCHAAVVGATRRSSSVSPWSRGAR